MPTTRFSSGLLVLCVAAAAAAAGPTALSAADKPVRLASAAAASVARPALLGVVVGPNGKPVVGGSVVLYTAAPIKGTSPFCPSCYPDCQKQALTDVQGQFRLAGLDPNLRFYPLVVARGFAPTFPPSVVPARGPVRFVLPAPRPPLVDARREFRGKVTGPDNKPVVGAKVELIGGKIKGQIQYGTMPNIDPLVVSDAKGTFALRCAEPNQPLMLKISARSLAAQMTPFLPAGSVAPHALPMETGAAVRGRITNLRGTPMAEAAVGIAQENRGAETFVGPLDIGTNHDGRFTLSNVTPNQDYVLYGTMDTFGSGSRPVFLPVQKFHVGASGSITDLGTLVVRPARRLTGKVVLPRNKPVPPHTRLLVYRNEAWDTCLVVLDKKGAFSVLGLPSETVGLDVSVPGYHIARGSKGYDTRRQQFSVSVENGDVNGLQILLEPNQPK